MAQLAISKDYFSAYARLPRKAQRKADEFLVKFQRDSASGAIHLEPFHRCVDAQLRSARIGDDYRLILRAPEQGDVFLVLWADHHDEAYRWAATKQTAVHPATGSLQIFDADNATRALTTVGAQEPEAEDATPPPGLFAAHSDSDLFLAGVPRALLPSVRAVVTDDELDRLLPHLPPEAGEVLTGLAAKLSLDEALEEVLGRVAPPAGAPPPPPVDVTDVQAALARDTTQRQFRLLDEGLDLDAALKHPLDVWRVFLHPRQRRIARSRTKGPMRVLGGAGTGKTVVALHRAGFLVREVYTKPDDRVLFTTFTVNLAQDLRTQLGKLLEPDELARVEITNIDSWASTYLRDRGRAFRPAFEKEQQDLLRAAYEVYGDDGYRVDFYRAEWRDVIQEQGLQTEQDYVLAVRRHRGIPLARTERRKLWPVFAAYRSSLEQSGYLEPVDILRAARAELEAARTTPRYQSVVVDEAQDFSANALRLVRTIAGPEHPDDLFLVGDPHQRIYGRAVTLSSCGIQVRGRRSQTLRLNYRTTGAICRWSLRALRNVEVDDLDDGKADRRGYVSLREGPAPRIELLEAPLEEERRVVETVRQKLGEGLPPENLCIVARTRAPLVDRFGPALTRAGVDNVFLEQEEPRHAAVRLATMHRVKGLEYPVVLLVALSEDQLPYRSPELRSEDPVVASLALVRERSLLYVAASRARDELYVFAAGTPSPLLVDMMTAPSRSPERRISSAPPPSPVAVATRAAGPPTSVLDTPLTDLHLPTRLMNWADRSALETLGDLARLRPAALLAERNLGRKSVADARATIESLVGQTWESFLASQREVSDGRGAAATPSLSLEAAALEGNWDAARAALTDEQGLVPLDDMELSARIRGYAARAGLRTLGDLAQRSRQTLIDADNLGRASARDLPKAVAEHFERGAQESALAAQGLLEGFKALLQQLDPMLRIILTRRSGLGGEAQTLKELGETFGVTRERIRQLETKANESLRRREWAREVRRRVDIAVTEGAASLDDLSVDPWWSSAATSPDVVQYVVEDVLEAPAYVIELDEGHWLSRHKRPVVSAAWESMLAAASAVALPAPPAAFDPLLEPAAQLVGPRLAAHLFGQLRERLQIDERPGAPASVVAMGDTRRAELLAILRSSPEPIRVDDLFRRIGRRVHIPDDVIHFGRGTIGVKQHFPDFEAWQARLVPRAVRVVETLGPQRQWSCTELLDELREEQDIPEWLTAYGLAALIKHGTGLVYLGRLRVALPGTPENESRVYVHDALEELLREAGAPVLRDEAVAKIRARLGVSDFALQQVFTRPQFVRVDQDRIGLLERDVPGGVNAIAEAVEHVEALLSRRERGLSSFHLHQEVRLLSAVHAEWSEPLTLSLIRSDGRFRLSQGGAVGLARWESTRVPTRLELVRSALAEAAGRVSVEALMARIEAHYGERPTRAAMGGIAQNIGAGLDGEWMVKREGLPT
jgi:superfamily I DNA/RNA helicase/mRNA-degrading endonuclease RelE of RelBE toxin-antitoxin system